MSSFAAASSKPPPMCETDSGHQQEREADQRRRIPDRAVDADRPAAGDQAADKVDRLPQRDPAGRRDCRRSCGP